MAKLEYITKEEIYRKAREFQIGDCVCVKDENGKETEAVLERFYPHLVQFKRMDGRTFTTDYLTAARGQFICTSDFMLHSEEMDRNALVSALGRKKVENHEGM